MSEVSDLVTSLTSLTDTFLGSGYSELKYKYDVEKNFTLGSSDKYGVIASDINNTDGVTKAITVNQTYEIKLTKGYKELTKDDSSLDEARIALFDLGFGLYKRIIEQKAGSPSIVMNILDFTSEMEEFEENKVVANTISFTVIYRKFL